MRTFKSPLDLVRRINPERPVACGFPDRLRSASEWFQSHFRGNIMYAVKANPSDWVLSGLYESGMRFFDVASDREIEQVHALCPDAILAYMNPIKPRFSIERAYRDYGVRIFAFDCMAELDKILEATGFARDLTLIARMAVSNSSAELPIDGKFGASPAQMVQLLRTARSMTSRLGVSFHVGSQCMDPDAWRVSMEMAADRLTELGVEIDVLDVGGGFPVAYPGMTPPPMADYMDAIHEAIDGWPLDTRPELWCEPGRALVAEAVSIIARVDLVRGDALYLNDGAYGTLYDAAHHDWPFPLRVLRSEPSSDPVVRAYKCFGPTCDADDVMPGPYMLPDDVCEGEFVEFGMLGAYGTAMASRFNGFGETDTLFSETSYWPSIFQAADQLLLPLEAGTV